MTKAQLPRGIRNHNPGNIEWGDPWQGLAPTRTDPRFAQFQSPAHGIRALARTLITYQDKHNIRTVRQAIRRWAPPTENDTGAYINQVAAAAEVGPDHQINLHDWHTLRPIVEAIIRHENGRGPLATANTWYDAATIDHGLLMAGVQRPVTEVARVPATKETLGATVTGAVGALEIADALPGVVSAIQGAEGHLSSGNVVRIAVGVVLVGAAAFIAYGQVRKHRAGVL